MRQDFKVVNSKNCTYIDFFGDIDDSVCPKYKDEISALIEENKEKDMVFNFKEVTFIDSSGIGMILGRYNQLKKHRKKLYINETNEHVHKLFKISGIYTIIHQCDRNAVGEKQ